MSKRKRTIEPEVADSLVKSLNGRYTPVRDADISDIEALVVNLIIMGGKWVLIDRREVKGNPSSSRYVALRRRGFEVRSIHVDGIRNYWGRWSHGDAPPLPLVPGFKSDNEDTVFGADHDTA